MVSGKTINCAFSCQTLMKIMTSNLKMTCIPSLFSHRVVLISGILISAILPSSSSGHALCPIRCTCDENKLSVDCKEASLDLVPITLNPSILELYLPRNNIKSITSSLHFYRKLLFLDLSANSLSSLESGNFISQKALKVLILNNNRISALDSGCFQGLENLRILTMSSNSLKGISRNSLTPLKHLEKLDISRNELISEALHPLAFDSLKHNLKTLDLSHNRMSFLPEKTFYGLSNLSSLNLAFNGIGRSEEEEGVLRNNSFVHLTSLTELNLESNQIHSLQSHTFLGLENSLESLDLSSNHLEIIPTTALSILSKLSRLSISRNRIIVLTNNCLQGLSDLKTFVLKNDDNLRAIEVDAFSSNPLLEKISLDYCPNLKSLHEETFLVQRQSSLRQVSLRANGLSKLPRHLLDWNNLVFLDVRGNPFNCSDVCFVKWLSGVLHNNNNKSVSDESLRETLCQDPVEFKGHELASIPAACFDDYPQQHQQPESGDDDPSNTESSSSSGETMSTVIVSALSFSTLVCAGTFALTLFCFLRRRKERLAESRLKDYFAASLLNHQQHSYMMSSGQHAYDSYSHQLHQPHSLQHYHSSPLHHDSFGQQEHDLILKKDDDDANIPNDYYYASITTNGPNGLTSAGPVTASFETANGHRLYENQYQELESSLNANAGGLSSVTTPLLNSNAASKTHNNRNNTRNNNSHRSQQQHHSHAMSSSSFLTSSPPTTSSSSATSSSTSSCYPTTTSSSLSSYPEANPYATSIVIQHPIKINSNLYRV